MESRKLFVGGLPPSARADELRGHFGRYGEVLAVRVVRDRETGLPRGFAFVDFADDAAAQRALGEAEKHSHVFAGYKVDVKRAKIRPTRNDKQILNRQNTYNNIVCNPKKLFVGGLRNITRDDLESYFQKFGKVIDVVVIEDASTHKPRGFGFVTFDSDEAVKKAMENTFHNLNGKQVEIKIAIHRRFHRDVGIYQPFHPYTFNSNYMVLAHNYMYSPYTTGHYAMMGRQNLMYTSFRGDNYFSTYHVNL